MPKTVLITGAARGIGRATALAFAAGGWNIAINYRASRQQALGLMEEAHALGVDAEVFQADISQAAEANNLAGLAGLRFGKIDALVCNAGIAQQRLFTDITDTDWADMLNTNLTGAFNICRAVLPGMISRKAGAIVTVSSVWGVHGASCEVHYSAAKAGLVGLTKALAKEAGPSGITVNCLAPGVIKTDMLSAFSAADLAELAGATPLGRIGTPEDVAQAAVFLCSAPFITGQVLGVDGGFPA